MTRRHAVVLGGGLAGMLAASVLARQVDQVTIVERDRLPDGPMSRNGVPQSHHAHLVLPGGVQSLEALLPGLAERTLMFGASRLGVPGDLVALSDQGWLPRYPDTCFALSCSRGLLEWVVRERVLRDERIEVAESSDAEQLCGSRTEVTGALVRTRKTGELRRLDADVVVDATGVGSRAPEWLRALGAAEVPEEVVDPGLAYSSRLYLAPSGAKTGFPAVFVRPRPEAGHPEQAGTLLPIENGQWLVSLAGTRGAEPPTDIAGFERFAGDLRHGVIGDLLAGAEPVGGARGYRNNVNRRRHFGRVPSGFVAVGDAVTMTNSVYSHGVTLAAQSAVALRDGLARHGPRRGSSRVQRDVLGAASLAWNLAISRDILYPGARGPRVRGARWRHRLANRARRVAASQPELFATVLGVDALASPPTRMLTPSVLRSLLHGGPALSSEEPPFTSEELTALRGARRRTA